MDLPLPGIDLGSSEATSTSGRPAAARRAPQGRPQPCWRRPEGDRPCPGQGSAPGRPGASCSARGGGSSSRRGGQPGSSWRRSAAATAETYGFGGGGGAFGDGPAPLETAVFPRIKEKDPYKLLGISPEASYEEVQAARNYLYDTYTHHKPSQEAIDWAHDTILGWSYKARAKYGFQPPQTGRKGELKGDGPRLSWLERVRDRFEPDVPTTTLVNDGTIFLALAVWAAFQPRDPTFPVLGTLGYALYRFSAKRKARTPEGPFLGGTPVWGAILSTLLSAATGVLLGTLSAIIFKSGLGPLNGPGIVNLCLCLVSGLASIYLK